MAETAKKFMEAADAMGSAVSKKFEKKTMQTLLDSFGTDWKKRYLGLAHHGTDNNVNLRDPMGDGDTSLLRYPMSEYHRSIFSVGGDVHEFAMSSNCPSFIKCCLIGNASVVRKELESCSSLEAKTALLETRYSILRFSAIYFTIVGMRQLVGGGGDHPGVLKLLLEHGARVNARDLIGKTVMHYIIGPLCTVGDQRMFDMADMCIQNGKEKGLPTPLVNITDR
jgi:hypothetical protein